MVEEAEQGCHMCLVGTKVDLVNEQLAQRAVRKEEVDALAAKHKAHSFETSAKQGSGVGEIFQCIVEGFQARVQAVDDGRKAIEQRVSCEAAFLARVKHLWLEQLYDACM